MKKVLAILTVVALLGIGTAAFANGFGYGPGYMMGNGGYGRMMNGYGPGYATDTATQEFLDKTALLRKDFNDKRFEYAEAIRTGDKKKAETLSKVLEEISAKIYALAPKPHAVAWNGRCW